MINVNAATIAKDKGWLLEHLEGADIEFEDLSAQKVLIAVHGPEAIPCLQAFVDADLMSVKAYGHLEAPVCGGLGFLARTGYTGEDGFEVMVDPEVGVSLWRSLLLLCLSACFTPVRIKAKNILKMTQAMSQFKDSFSLKSY